MARSTGWVAFTELEEDDRLDDEEENGSTGRCGHWPQLLPGGSHVSPGNVHCEKPTWSHAHEFIRQHTPQLKRYAMELILFSVVTSVSIVVAVAIAGVSVPQDICDTGFTPKSTSIEA